MDFNYRKFHLNIELIINETRYFMLHISYVCIYKLDTLKSSNEISINRVSCKLELFDIFSLLYCIFESCTRRKTRINKWCSNFELIKVLSKK